jgi:predicted transcriptional regulator
MPKIDDPNIKIKTIKPFKRESIRHWDGIEKIAPRGNREPIGNQLVTDISNQLVINKEPIGNQLVNKNEPQKTNKESISNPISNRNKEPNSNQLVTQLVTDKTSLERVKKLWGLQKKILFYIVESCMARGQLTSGAITNETFRIIANTDADTVKTAIQRLKNKGLITKEPGKRGKGGFTSYIITEAVRNAIIEDQRQVRNSNQLVTQLVTDNSNQLVINKEPYKEPNVPSSSSYNNLTTTTNELPAEWEELDISGLSKMNFTKTKLKEIYNFGCDYENVRRSISAASYDIKAGKEISLALFMSTVKMKKSEYSATAKGYIDPLQKEEEENAQRLALRADAIRKARLRALDDELEVWVDENTKEIERILPSGLIIPFRANGLEHVELKEYLINYYIENIKNK